MSSNSSISPSVSKGMRHRHPEKCSLGLGVRVLLVVRFHATRGQDLVAAYPQQHGLSDRQLTAAKMLCMQERLEASPNQQSQHFFKLPARPAPAAEHELFGYSHFLRCKDVAGSARGYFHQSLVLVASAHAEVGLCSSAALAYRAFFFDVLSRLSRVLSDLPALEASSGNSGSSAKGPSSHTEEGLHHTLYHWFRRLLNEAHHRRASIDPRLRRGLFYHAYCRGRTNNCSGVKQTIYVADQGSANHVRPSDWIFGCRNLLRYQLQLRD